MTLRFHVRLLSTLPSVNSNIHDSRHRLPLSQPDKYAVTEGLADAIVRALRAASMYATSSGMVIRAGRLH